MNESIEILIVKYISGQASEEEALAVKEWIKLSKSNEADFFQFYETWNHSLHAHPELIDTERAYQAFLDRIADKRPVAKLNRSWPKIAAAAVFLLICLSGLFYYQKSESSSWNIVKTRKGETLKMTLPDGTHVWLNAGTVFRYEKDFGKTSRSVYLNGEAYFDISSGEKGKPFLVYTDNYVIHDIGTVFNVKAYSDEQIFETAVIEGQISVQGRRGPIAKEKQVLVNEKQALRIRTVSENIAPDNFENDIADAGKPINVVDIEASQISGYSGWKDNLLLFEDETFAELSKALERKYDVSIKIKDEELQYLKYTGSFKDIKSVREVLEIIKKTTPIDFSVIGSEITITKAKR